MEPFYSSILILGLATVLDQVMGEPPRMLHPTVWMGKIIEFSDKKISHGNWLLDKAQGVLLATIVIVIFLLSSYYSLLALEYLGPVPSLIVSVFLLKSTFAIRDMERHVMPVAVALWQGRLGDAKELLRLVVRRNPDDLTEQQVLSATVETIAEGTVDAVTGPLFFYFIFGVPGAIAYRVINTLDAMIGYRDLQHMHEGWFSAKLDTIVNYLPARITGIFTIVSARILKLDATGSAEILAKDHASTESMNAGWTMSSMAGALGIMLEKPGQYRLGEPTRELVPDDIGRALKIMKLNIALFVGLIGLPLTFLSRIEIRLV